MKATLSTREVAERLGVSITTVNRMVQKGRIKSFQPMGPDGEHFFDPKWVDEAIRLSINNPELGAEK